jgi:DNA-directed RNA polymerase specialized sigma24 family protein
MLRGTSQKKESSLSQDDFDELLAWLHLDRDQAGKIYEDIRQRLIRIFAYRGCPVAEDLADETINRVAKKVRDLRSTYVGNPLLYFHGVARYVYLEYVRLTPEPLPAVLISQAEKPEESELAYTCLEQCMGHLTPNNRAFVLEYFQDEKRAKIEHRKELTQRLGITLNALRIRAHRICTTLKKCMHECLETARL